MVAHKIKSGFIVGALALGAISLSPSAVLADAHGNDLVHSREFNGQVYMMNETHFSLYFYANDTENVSNCSGGCAASWPPALLDMGSQLGENYSLFARDDGKMQIAFKGRPLYRFGGDANVGDINGDGVGGVWKLARP